MRGKDGAPLMISGVKGQYPQKKAPIGVYDAQMLCGACEGLFQKVDNYGVDVLLRRFPHFFKPIRDPVQGDIGFESSSCDPLQILEFLVSILYRAAMSTQPFFNRVSLGSFEEQLRQVIMSRGSFTLDVFDAVLSRWNESDDGKFPTNFFMNPHRERWGGVNAYRLYLGRTVAYVKVDSRPFPETLAALSLRSGPVIHVISRGMAESKDLAAMKKTAIVAEINRLAFKRGGVQK